MPRPPRPGRSVQVALPRPAVDAETESLPQRGLQRVETFLQVPQTTCVLLDVGLERLDFGTQRVRVVQGPVEANAAVCASGMMSW